MKKLKYFLVLLLFTSCVYLPADNYYNNRGSYNERRYNQIIDGYYNEPSYYYPSHIDIFDIFDFLNVLDVFINY